MAKLSDNAQRVYDHLPEDGEKLGGIAIQRELGLSKLDYQRARDELKTEGLVISGKGRGGTLARIEGKAPEAKKSRAEALELAREEKQAKSRAKKELDRQIDLVIEYFAREGHTVNRSDISFSDNRPVVAVWEGPEARMYGIPHAEWDRLVGRY